MTVTRELVALLKEEGYMIAFAESCTGGLVAAALTSVPGSSEVFDRGFVTYSNAAKIEMLGVFPKNSWRSMALSAPKSQLPWARVGHSNIQRPMPPLQSRGSQALVAARTKNRLAWFTLPLP